MLLFCNVYLWCLWCHNAELIARIFICFKSLFIITGVRRKYATNCFETLSKALLGPLQGHNRAPLASQFSLWRSYNTKNMPSSDSARPFQGQGVS